MNVKISCSMFKGQNKDSQSFLLQEIQLIDQKVENIFRHYIGTYIFIIIYLYRFLYIITL